MPENLLLDICVVVALFLEIYAYITSVNNAGIQGMLHLLNSTFPPRQKKPLANLCQWHNIHMQ